MRSESVEILADVARDADRWGLTEYTTAVHGHRSSGVGLIELAEAVDADLIVIGSAPGSANGRGPDRLDGRSTPAWQPRSGGIGDHWIPPYVPTRWADSSSRSRTPRRAAPHFDGPRTTSTAAG